MKRLPVALALTIVLSSVIVGYTQQRVEAMPSDPKATPAYRVLVLRKSAVEAELVELSAMFTGQHPDVLNKRFELDAIGVEMEKMEVLKKFRAPKLSDIYGNLVLRKVSLEVELNNLLRSFKPQHPAVEKKRVEMAAIKRELENTLQ